MHPQQSQDNRHQQNAGVLFSWVYFLALSHASCFLVLLRKRCGTHAFGFNGLLAFVMIPLYAAAAQAPEMPGFFLLWFAALVIQRLSSVARCRRGEIEHSRYTGWPWLALCCPLVRREVTAKGIIEPVLCLISGSLLMPLSPPLGGFVMLGTFSVLFTAGVDREINRARLRAMRDAKIEHEQLSERCRGIRHDV